MDLGVALRAARERLRLTIAAAAQLVGISAAYLGQLERAKSCPSVAVAEDLVRVLHLPSGVAAWLRAVAAPDAGRSHPARPPADHLAAEVGQEITRMLLEAEALPTVPAGRELEREHGWRTLRVAGQIEARTSRADEQRFADEAAARTEAQRREREAQHGEAVADLERRITAAQGAIRDIRPGLVRVAGGVTRDDYRDLDQARRLLHRLKTRHRSADTI